MVKAIKWLTIVLVMLGLALVAMRLYTNEVVNPRVASELQDNPAGEKAAKVLLLKLPNSDQLPVNYLQEGSLVFLGADGRWWRQFQPAGAEVEVFIKGEWQTGRARVVLDNPKYTQEIFAKLRPTAPKWLPAWLNGKLIVVELGKT